MARWWLCIALLLVAGLHPGKAWAAVDTYGQAMTKCQTALAANPGANQNGWVTVCKAGDSGAGAPAGQRYFIQFWQCKGSCSWLGAQWYFDGVIPTASDVCRAVPQLSNYQQAGKLTSTMIWCKAGVPAPDGNGTISCTMKWTPGGPPTQNQWGSWHTLGSLTASGDTCDGSGTGPGAWQQIGPDGSKTTPSPLPSNAPADQSSAPPPNQSCGGGSCYDAANDKFCAVSGGSQVCVSGSQARSASGGCASVGDATLCAGAPPPVPGAPPASPISNPASEIKASDTWTQADKNTGANQTVTVNTYGASGSAVGSGQKPGDTGPASSSSSPTPPGDGTTSSGGGDCNTPPIVQGSGGLSAVAYQTWRTRCSLEGQKGGTGSGVGTLYTKSSDTAQSVVAGFQASVQDAPIAGAVTGFFSVGSVSGACPTWTLAATEWNPQMTFDFYCRPEASDMLDMARVVLLIACAYVAFVIAMGDS